MSIENCLELIHLAAPGLRARMAVDKWHGEHARVDLEGAKAVRVVYLYWGPGGQLELHLYPGDTLEQAQALYREPRRMEGLLGLRDGGWKLRPNFHFGFMATGLTWTESRIDTDAYAKYWLGRIETLGIFRRVDWDRELDTLIADGIFDPADRAQFDCDFTHTKRGAATPRPGLCLSRAWKRGDTLAGGFVAELSGVLSQALSVLGESHG